MNTQLPGYYTVLEAAGEMGVDERTVERWIADGKLSVDKKVGHLRLISDNEVERFKAEWVKGRKTR